ncbi:PREDICTED: TMV resistance protein N-like [Prunus mume]|uniref:TMV resistance protein N-like n=1 Tax=Prunus mume TaxID=102107 RepID=A0ABM0NYL6_PRUMU|nr:PREDICTED: TMV resistance protein N-like [Prunus mume]
MFFKSLFRFMGSWVTPPLPTDFGVEPQLPSNLPPMTTQPDSSSPSSSPYDVFLSFRGADTRTNFTDHLCNALVGKGIHTFIDDDELPRGEEISPALVKAIEESRISVIVFSENYASSRWCLDELVKILQCKQSKQQVVLPIFYKVDPSDVRKQTNSFGDAFKGLIRSEFKDDKEKVLIWKEALRQAANLSGHTFKDGESEATFINDIVDGILRQVLRRTYWNVAEHPVGIQSHVLDVKKLLDVGENGRRIVGIWGTSGIGKTTIAKAIWNAIAHEFEGSCFLENVRDGSLVQLQKTLLHKYLGKKLKIQSVDEGIGVIRERLRRKKILLILDDVDRLEQLEKLAGDDWFGEGSRVIFTTKNRRLFENRDIKLIHEVKKLDSNQALELFSWHAFRRSEPPEDYLELAQRAIAFADGLPLALTILGSHLRGIVIRRWQVILDGYEGEPYTDIERILQKSYDALDHRAKDYFLDIACFFKCEDKDYVLQIVPQKFIEEFVDKALITIELNYRILMHDLLANLGKVIVRKESPDDPGQRSRLWFYEDVKRVLTESTGTRNIKGIVVKFPEPAEITLNPECFRNMVNLQIFKIHNASLRGNINYLPNALRIIDWPSCQLQSLPPNFQGNRLVEFEMPGSHIRQLEGFKHLPNLTYMNLSDSQFLEKIPDLSGIPNIEFLDLSNCTSLVEVHDSVGFLDKLVELNLAGCVNLTRFGTRLRLKSLESIWLDDCKRLESFPEIEVEMESLLTLTMDGSGIRELPLSIANLTGLKLLSLPRCFNLNELQLLYCLSTLQFLYLSGYNFVTLPECISKFVRLYKLSLRDCESLLEIPQEVLPLSLHKLYLDNCTSLEKIPKLPLSARDKQLFLMNCDRLRGYDITENSILDQVSSHPQSEFEITLPGDEVPKWFSCCKDATLVKYADDEEELCHARCEVCFEIPPNLDWKTLRLVLCVVNKGGPFYFGANTRVHINRKEVQSIFMLLKESHMGTHVALQCIPLLNLSNLRVGEELTRLQQGNMCQIIFEFRRPRLPTLIDIPTPVKILCGVHLLGHQVLLPDVMAVNDDIHDDQHQDNELLSLPSTSETSVGKKRPRLSDFMALDDDHRANVVEVSDHEAQRGEANHPKRRHTDLNEEPKQ